MRYTDEFLGLKCASDMLSLKLFPNTKEISESLLQETIDKCVYGEAFVESGEDQD